jgi:hypothetical protein
LQQLMPVELQKSLQVSGQLAAQVCSPQVPSHDSQVAAQVGPITVGQPQTRWPQVVSV